MIIIDPGHGGIDSGGGTNDFWLEKDKVLDISRYQERRFKDHNIPVVLTRSTDESLDPTQRINRVNEISTATKDDILISNHVNVNDKKLDGAEFYYSKNHEPTLPMMMAKEITEVGQNNRGVILKLNSSGNDFYFIIRNTQPREAILVEYGYADSPGDDVTQLLYEWPALAEAIVKAIVEYKGVNYIPPSFIVYIVRPGDTLFNISQEFDVTVDELMDYNELTNTEILVGQTLFIPNEQPVEYIEYVVQPGDTLSGIASKYNTTYQELMRINNLTSTTIYPGQVLLVPKVEEVEYIEYVVQPGDNLSSIANAYNTTYQELMRINNLTSTTIYPGQVLLVPKPKEIVVDYDVYIVKSGDTLGTIAFQYNTTVENLLQINYLTSTQIQPGQTLYVPKKETEYIEYTVKPGDTLSGIASQYNTTVQEIVTLNELTSTMIYVNQVLLIPII